MGYPEDLLEQANHLAHREPKRPKQASLRRAVSASYYALFHLLIESALKNWKPLAGRSEIEKAFDHGHMRRTLLNDVGQRSGQMQDVAKAFAKLQDQRHQADYRDEIVWSRTEVLNVLKLAEDSFSSWKRIGNTSEAQQVLVPFLVKSRR